jgi:hypothetical protein
MTPRPCLVCGKLNDGSRRPRHRRRNMSEDSEKHESPTSAAAEGQSYSWYDMEHPQLPAASFRSRAMVAPSAPSD